MLRTPPDPRAVEHAEADVLPDAPPLTAPPPPSERASEEARIRHARRRVVVVGAGAMGRHHVRTFSRLAASFDVVGVVDVEAEAAERVGAEFRVRPLALRALRGALRAKDVVVIASPIEAHVEGALLALASGCDVFVEKPLASTAREAWALVDEARRTGGRLFVGHVERFNPVVRALARRLPCETPRELTFRRVGPASPRSAGHGVLTNLAVHDFDLAAHLLGGAPRLVHAASGKGPSDSRGEDWTKVMLSCPMRADEADAVVTIWADRLSPTRERSLRIVTDRAVYEADLLARTLRMKAHGADVLSVDVAPADALQAQAEALAQALLGGTTPLASGEDGMHAVELADEARRAAASEPRGGRVRRRAAEGGDQDRG